MRSFRTHGNTVEIRSQQNRSKRVRNVHTLCFQEHRTMMTMMMT
jgi:hypothetical protein